MFRKSVFVDVINLMIDMQSPWKIWVGPKSNDKCPQRKAEGALTEREESHGREGHVKMEAEIRLMLPQPLEAGRDKEAFSFRAFGDSVALAMTLYFWPPEL